MTEPGMSAEERFFHELGEQLEDLTEKRASVKAILYGPSGVGKTTASVQIAQIITPPDKNILFIDSAEGWVSLQNFPALKTRVKRWTDSRVSTLTKLAEGISKGVAPFDTFGTVIIDEHSSIYDNDLAAVTAAHAASDSKKDPDTPTWPDMNTAKNRTLNLIGKYIRLDNVNVILIAHERRDKDNIQREVISPSYTPKARDGLAGMVHLVGRMTADERPKENGTVEYFRQVQVWPTTQVVAKTRIGGYSGVRIQVKELIGGMKEWLGGERETVADNPVVEEKEIPAAEPTDQPSDEVDDLVDQILS